MKPPFSRLQVVGDSMLPKLKPGQFIVSFNWFLMLNKGDLIILKAKGRLMVKRIQKCDDHQYFVVGDNPKASTDSRQFGWVSKDQVMGRVIYIFDDR